MKKDSFIFIIIYPNYISWVDKTPGQKKSGSDPYDGTVVAAKKIVERLTTQFNSYQIIFSD